MALDATTAVLEQEVGDQRAERLRKNRVANAHRTKRKKAMKKEHDHTHVHRWHCIDGATACL